MKRRYAAGGDVAVSGSPQTAFDQTVPNPAYGPGSGLGNNAPLVAITNAPTAAGAGVQGQPPMGMRKGGAVKKMAKGGLTRSVDGIALRGKTRAPLKKGK